MTRRGEPPRRPVGLVGDTSARRLYEPLNLFLGKAREKPGFARNCYQAVVIRSDILPRAASAAIVELAIEAILKCLRGS